ncbi:MAG: hypothetical protein KAX44_04145 [Candidatus Brocadiae bacterium]|nr:hypothetical protein [Candidatus Brocadiia bacterium]
MAEAYIDSASFYEIVGTLRRANPEQWIPWAWQSAVEVTSFVQAARHLRVVPGPSTAVARDAGGPYGDLMQALSEVVEIGCTSKATEEVAVSGTKAWATQNCPGMRKLYACMKKDRRNFRRWLASAVLWAWPEHSHRLVGLFDKAFVPEVSRILQVQEHYLEELHEQSCDVELLRHYSKDPPRKRDFYVLRDAYAVSALLRGVYHELVARKDGLVVMHHPMRNSFLRVGKPETVVPVNTAQYLARIVLRGAFAEKTLPKRISCYMENVRRVRGELLQGAFDLDATQYHQVAVEKAARAAKQARIRTHSRRLEEIIQVAVASGAGILTAFCITGCPALAVVAGTYLVERRRRVGAAIASAVVDTKRRYQDLAEVGSGRVERVWTR